MGIISAFIKAVAGVTLGMVVSGLLAKYAGVSGGLTLGSVTINYTDLIAIVVFSAVAFLARNRMPSVSQVMAIAAGSQIAFMIYKALSSAGLV